MLVIASLRFHDAGVGMDVEAVNAVWSVLLGEDPLKTSRDAGETVKSLFCRPPADRTTHHRQDATSEAQEYALIEPVGKGGMGEVFRARDIHLLREVALKMLRSDKVHTRSHSQFLAEAVVSGRLEHPNIVPIHRLGWLQEIPFIAMKLVGGATWHEKLHEASGQDLAKQLEVLLQLSNAVAFAHSRGVAHNDLKPSNVMIGEYGEVLLMDWGLATSFWEQAPAGIRHRSSITSPCGTPHYMSPELASGDGQAIGPSSDVYLLGGILYRLLSGRAPHAKSNYLECILSAMEGAVDPLDTSHPKELRQTAMRALAKDPERRHESVQELQAELRAYLKHKESLVITHTARLQLTHCEAEAQLDRDRLYEGFAEAVSGFRHARRLWEGNQAAQEGELEARLAYARAALAQRDLGLAEVQANRMRESAQGTESLAELDRDISTVRDLQERGKRNQKRLKRGLTGSLLCLFLGLSAGLLLFSKTNREIRAQNSRIDSQNKQLSSERQFAEEGLVHLTDQVRLRLLEHGSHASHQVGIELLTDAMQRWETLGDVRGARGKALARFKLAEIRYSIEGDVEHAIAETTSAVEAIRGLLADSPDDLELPNLASDALITLANLHAKRGGLETAFGLAQEGWLLAEAVHRARATSLQVRRICRAQLALAHILRDQGKAERAEGLLKDSLQRMLAVPEPALRDDGLFAIQRDLGSFMLGRDRLDAAATSLLAAQETAQRLVEQRPNDMLRLGRLASVTARLGEVYRRRGAYQQAREMFESGLRTHRRVVAADRSNLGSTRSLVNCLTSLAGVLKGLGETRAARDLVDEGIELQRGLVAGDSTNAQVLLDLSANLNVSASLSQAVGDWSEVQPSLEEAIVIQRRLVALDPTNLVARRAVGGLLVDLGLHLFQHSELDQAHSTVLEAHGLLSALRARDPSSASIQGELTNSLLVLGDILIARGDLDAASDVLNKALGYRRETIHASLDDPNAQYELGLALHRVGELNRQRGATTQARDQLRESIERLRTAATAESTNTIYSKELATALGKEASLHLDLGALRQAERNLREALAIRRRIAVREPGVEADVVATRIHIAVVLEARSEADDAIEILQQAVSDLDALGNERRAGRREQVYLVDALFRLGELCRKRKWPAKSQECFQRCIVLGRCLRDIDPSNRTVNLNLLFSLWRAGGALLGRNHLVAAAALFEEGVVLGEELSAHRPDDLALLFCLRVHLLALADAVQRQGDWERAQDLLRRAISTQTLLNRPGSPYPDKLPSLRDNLALCEQKQALFSGDVECGNSADYMVLALAQSERGEHAAAVVSLDEAVRRAPERMEAVFSRGQSRLAAGELEAALADFRAVVGRAPEHPYYRYMLAESLFLSGDFEGAAEAYGETERLLGGNAEILMACALAQTLAGDNDAGLQDIHRAMRLDSNPAFALWYAALSGQADALVSTPRETAWLRKLRAFLQGQLSETDLISAAQEAPEVIFKRQRWCEAHAMLGILAERQGRLEAARAHFRATVDTELSDFWEYRWARARLAALEEEAP